MSIFFLLICLPSFILIFQLNQTLFYYKRHDKRQSFCKLINFMIKENKSSYDQIKSTLKDYKRGIYDESNVHKDNSSEKNLIPNNFEQNDKTPNKVTFEELEIFFQEDNKVISNTYLNKYFSNCRNIMKLIAYIFLVSNLYWTMGLTVFLPEIIGFKSLYLNMFYLALADFIGIIIMSIFINTTRRKVLNFYHLISNILACIILIVLHQPQYQELKINKVLDIILSCKIY